MLKDFYTNPDGLNAITPYYSGGHICPNCGQRIGENSFHSCSTPYIFPFTPYQTYPLDKTEKAYAILKNLIEKKIIQEPKSYEDFCKVLETIRNSI